MSKSNYRDLDVWKKARRATREIYRETQSFPRIEMFGLVQQIRRAAVSIVSNIAEAHGRRTSGERANLLGVARGSAFEVESQLVIAQDLEYIATAEATAIERDVLDVIQMLNKLIRYYEKT